MGFKYKSIYTEIIAWVGFLVFQFILFFSIEPFIFESKINPIYLIYLLTNSLLILFFYLHHYLFLPKYFFTKKYTIYFFFIFIYLFGMISYCLLINLLIHFLIKIFEAPYLHLT